jgi:hypothetical protein
MHVVRLVSEVRKHSVTVLAHPSQATTELPLEAVKHVKLLIQYHNTMENTNTLYHGDKKLPLSCHLCWEQSNLPHMTHFDSLGDCILPVSFVQ